MSDLQPEFLILDKGLDVESPSVVAEKGTLSDVLNYERANIVGMRRVDGFVRFDGSVEPDYVDFVVLPKPEDGGGD